MGIFSGNTSADFDDADNDNFTRSSGEEGYSEEGLLSWVMVDIYGTEVLCEQETNGDIASSVYINASYSVPADEYRSWCTDSDDVDYIPLSIYILSYLFPAVGFLCNFIVCIVMAKSKRFKRNFSNFHIFNLALTDLLFRCIFAPVSVELADPKWLTSWGCKLLSFVNFTTLAVTFALLAGVAIDRYLNICHPFRAKQFTWKCSRNVVCLSWIYAIVFSSPIAVSKQFGDPLEQLGTVFQNWSAVVENDTDEDKYRICYYVDGLLFKVSSTLYLIFAFTLPLLIIIYSYGAVLKLLWKRSRNRMINGRIAKSKLKAVKMLVIIVMVYICSWGPYLVILVFTSYGLGIYNKDRVQERTVVEEEEALYLMYLLDDIALIASCSSCVANPLIFVFYSRNFRNALKKTFFTNYCSAMSKHQTAVIRSQLTKLKSSKLKSFYSSSKTYEFGNELQVMNRRIHEEGYTLKVLECPTQTTYL